MTSRLARHAATQEGTVEDVTVAGSWYEDFFDQDYLAVFGPYVEGERASAEATSVEHLLELPAGSRLLDLCCGQGRHAVRLRARGYDVVGLDLSPVLLAAARARDPELRLLRADMRRLPVAAGSFDGVVNLFNAFGYFERTGEDAAVLADVARVLRPGGRFVQEVHHRDAVVDGWQAEQEHPPFADGTRLVERRDWDPVRSRHRVVYELHPPQGPARRRVHELRVYTLTELVSLHEQAGLRVREVHGDVHGTPLRPGAVLPVIVSERPG